MLTYVSEKQLFVGEELRIVKNRFAPTDAIGTGHTALPRLCITTGIHGDELEGQYVAYLVAQRIKQTPQHLHGIVDIYPALNPLGISCIERGIPQFDLDMNRIFPGNEEGSAFESVASAIIGDITGADLCLDIHASNIYLCEIPQIRINEISESTLMPWAMCSNVDFVWVHANATVLEGTLAYSLNAALTPTLVIEMGVGMRITAEYGMQMTCGIFNLMHELDIWDGPVQPVRKPIAISDKQVRFINADTAGLFLPCAPHDHHVKHGQMIGRIVDPATGTVIQQLASPIDGLLFTLREYPIVYPGSLIARILGGTPC